MRNDSINIIGIMTGNSLDAVDLVLTQYSDTGAQTDLFTHSVEIGTKLKEDLKWLRTEINDAKGDVSAVANKTGDKSIGRTFPLVSASYIELIAKAVKELVSKAEPHIPGLTVDLLGLHGQTCAHCPPSIAQSKDPNMLYTVQVGDGQKLADLTGIAVVYDFRSDDLMNLGEAAPLAPVHHQHLAEQTKRKGQFPIAFCNAGNTGNITIITEDINTSELQVRGWDTGPFNNFPDKLVQAEKSEDCDIDGSYGKAGSVNVELLDKLFNTAVMDKSGENFLLKPPPRSSDPEWYKIIPELTSGSLSFADRIRTAEYFSAYIYYHTLGFLPDNLRMPFHFAVCGGGWKNPVAYEHFKGLIAGDFKNNPVLAEHTKLFNSIFKRMQTENPTSANCDYSEAYGFDGGAMEARIFADAAHCRLTGEPFSLPTTTGAIKPTVAGIIRFPQGRETNASPAVISLLDKHNTRTATLDRPDIFDGRWSRAAAGWNAKLQKN